MWENQTAPHCYDCQRLQQEQAPEQREGGMGGRKRGGRWGGGVCNKEALFSQFPGTQIKNLPPEKTLAAPCHYHLSLFFIYKSNSTHFYSFFGAVLVHVC